MRRLLLVVNLLIALALIAAGAVFYWVFYRALPQSSGTIEANVSQPVEVMRDDLGVPHIKARTLEDAVFVEGYSVAEDRLWQMDGMRRLAAGELSEIIGPATLEADRESRRFRMRRIAEQIYAGLSDPDKAILAAYARGVNAFIDSHRGRYGFEFTALQYDPRPWSAVDSILAGLQMFRTLTNEWRTKLIKLQMLNGGERDKVNYLFPQGDPNGFLPGADIHPGSNAWAVAGAHSANGKPLLSNDMHLEYAVPGLWHMTHLEAPGINVAGVELPGFPGVIVGHNDRIAWGVTNLGFDVQDLYFERMDLRTGQYVFENKLEQARQERELIVVKGRQPEEFVNWVTRHGPIVQQGNGAAITVKWAAADATIFHNIFIDIDRAHNWDEFKAALSRFGGPGQNFVYADVDGNIAYHAAGKLPIRRNYQGDVPVDGSTGQNEWDGYIPFDELPQALNPKDGYVVSANQNPFPPDFPYHMNGNFAPRYRSRQILDMLRARGNKVSPRDDLTIEKDVYSGFNKFLAKQIVAAYDKRGASNPLYGETIQRLRSWDGQMDKERPEPFVTNLVFQYLRKAVAERASPGSGALYDQQISSAVVDRILRERLAGWFNDYGELVLRCFADAMEEGRRIQGKNPNAWKWGKSMFFEAANPVGGKLPWVGRYFTLGPVPMSGSSTTVKQTSRRISPSQRMNVSVGNWDDSLASLPIGESGHVASSHYMDQWEGYYYGRAFPMQFTRIDGKSKVTFQPKR